MDQAITLQSNTPVSYTHLDVYKRQVLKEREGKTSLIFFLCTNKFTFKGKATVRKSRCFVVTITTTQLVYKRLLQTKSYISFAMLIHKGIKENALLTICIKRRIKQLYLCRRCYTTQCNIW